MDSDVYDGGDVPKAGGDGDVEAHRIKNVQIRIRQKGTAIGDAGYRSPYLSHAKRALYHLSYIPERVARLWSTSCRQAKEMRSIQDRGVAGTRGFHRKSQTLL